MPVSVVTKIMLMGLLKRGISFCVCVVDLAGERGGEREREIGGGSICRLGGE